MRVVAAEKNTKSVTILTKNCRTTFKSSKNLPIDRLYNILYYIYMTNLVAISDARANLPELVNRVNKNMDRVVITINGQPKAVLVSEEELESLEETAEIFASNPNIKKDLKKSEKQIKEGKFVFLSNLE